MWLSGTWNKAKEEPDGQQDAESDWHALPIRAKSAATMPCRDLNTLLLDLYQCPTDSSRWPMMLDRVCDTMQARSAVIQLLVNDDHRPYARWMVRDTHSEAVRALHDRYFADEVNPRLRIPDLSVWKKLPDIVRDTDLFEVDDPIYADLQQRLAAVQLGFFTSVRIPISEHETLALILHRDSQARKGFTGRDENFALTLMPHLRQAIQLTSTLQQRTDHVDQLNQALNQVRTALLLCSADGSVHWMNHAAQHILTQRDCLRVVDHRLKATHAQENMQLRRMIADAAGTPVNDAPSVQRLLVLHGTQASHSELQVRAQSLESTNISTPFAFPSCWNKPVLLMFSDPGTHPSLPAGLLGTLFTLSPAEARLAAALCQGLSTNEYAHQQDLSVGTVRFQLKQIMAKTRVSRQSQLIQRFYSSVIAHTLSNNHMAGNH